MTKHNSETNACLNVAFLDGVPGQGGYEYEKRLVWNGVAQAAQKRNANLLYFAGDHFEPTFSHGTRRYHYHSVIYDLIDVGVIDGIVEWDSFVGSLSSDAATQSFLSSFRSLPLVTIERVMEGFPAVILDTEQGVRDLLTHLIDVHGYRRIACNWLRDARSSQMRHQAYVDVMTERGLYDPGLLIEAGESYAGHEEGELRPGIDYDAMIATEDVIAMEAIPALKAQGVSVPGDVAVTGFNDGQEARAYTPPLTTVQLPFYDMGHRAVDLLFDMIEGQQVPEVTRVPMRLVVRRSCGCLDAPLVAAADVTQLVDADRRPLTDDALRREIAAGVVQAAGSCVPGLDTDRAERLVDAFVADLGASSTAAVEALEEMLLEVAEADGDLTSWQDIVSALRRGVLPYLVPSEVTHAESLWGQARVLIGAAAQRAQINLRLQAEQQDAEVQALGQQLITTFQIEALMDVLAEGLSRLGIPGCYLALYENPSPYEYPYPIPEWSRLILAYNEQERVQLEPEGRRFPSRALVPQGMLPTGRPRSYLVESLFFQEQQIGFVLFEVGSREGKVYEQLRRQISTALQGALLVQRVQEHSAELARQQYILDTFMENVPDRVYFKDLESRITRANKAHAINLGLSDPSEEIGKSDFDFFPEEQARIKYEQEQEIIRTGQPILHLEEPDGLGNWALTTKMPLRDENGEIIGVFGISRDITAMKEAEAALEKAYAEVEQQVRERTAELERAQEESLRLQQEVIEAQQRAIRELSTPIIPVLEGVIVMPLIGSIDTMRAWDVTRNLLTGIREHRAKVVILDITGVPVVDSGVAAYLTKAIQAARLKGARTIVTGVSDAVAETIVDLGIDWSGVETLSDLQMGLRVALQRRRPTGIRLSDENPKN